MFLHRFQHLIDHSLERREAKNIWLDVAECIGRHGIWGGNVRSAGTFFPCVQHASKALVAAKWHRGIRSECGEYCIFGQSARTRTPDGHYSVKCFRSIPGRAFDGRRGRQLVTHPTGCNLSSLQLPVCVTQQQHQQTGRADIAMPFFAMATRPDCIATASLSPSSVW